MKVLPHILICLLLVSTPVVAADEPPEEEDEGPFPVIIREPICFVVDPDAAQPVQVRFDCDE